MELLRVWVVAFIERYEGQWSHVALVDALPGEVFDAFAVGTGVPTGVLAVASLSGLGKPAMGLLVFVVSRAVLVRAVFPFVHVAVVAKWAYVVFFLELLMG